MQTDPRVEEAWSRIQDDLRAAFSDSIYQNWLSSLRPVRIDRATMYVWAPRETRDWVKRRFGSVLDAAISARDRTLRRVELVAEEEDVEQPGHHRPERSTTPQQPVSARLNHSFDSFVIGDGNRFAHAAALAVAELPGQTYNPLLLYGPPGVGKSHLLQAIGAYVCDHDPAARVQCTTLEAFTSQFTTALRSDRIAEFKTAYRECDLLLLDEVQFLDGKTRTAEELFHTLDAAIEAGVQVVLTADRHPSAFSSLDHRLRERLQGGLAVDICPPEQSLRLAILRKLAQRHAHFGSNPEVLEHLAGALTTNVRILTAALTRLAAYASLTSSEVTLGLAEQVLSQLYPTGGPAVSTPLTIASIQQETAAYFDVLQPELSSAKRGRRLVYARQVAMYLSRELTPLSLSSIASQFGGRDHTTVLHAHRKVKGLLLTDPDARTDVNSIVETLSAPAQPSPHTRSA